MHLCLQLYFFLFVVIFQLNFDLFVVIFQLYFWLLSMDNRAPMSHKMVYITYITRAVLRLECSLDCISGSVGHQQNIFIFSLSAFLLKLKKCNYKKCNWVSGSPSILYKLVLSPVPIVHTNFQENLLMSYSWCPQLSR